jgi:hypothetical protein
VRPALGWGREIELSIPVHDPDRWNQKDVREALHEAVDFLTGDKWTIGFYARARKLSPPRQGRFTLPGGVTAVIPFSDGLDSRAVAGLIGRELGEKLIRVRLGARSFDAQGSPRSKLPFTSVPYNVQPDTRRFSESSARSRGFKFALISGIAAYLSKASQIIVPESGQGALGPTLVPVGQAYEDYRSHPLFTDRMQKFFTALLNFNVRFVFPQLWSTKGETLAKYVNEHGRNAPWSDTWSCWQQNTHVSVVQKKRQCGICAACMLRRLSIHAAGLVEPKEHYVWEDLGASTFEGGAVAEFDKKKITRAQREYAIAGVLHLDHLAALRHSSASAKVLDHRAAQLGQSLRLADAEVHARLNRLLSVHESEWKSFVLSLGSTSFLADWAIHVQ